MAKFKGFLRLFLPIAFVSTAASGLIYISVQQVLRQAANDPQIQIAKDLALALQNGKTAQEIIGQTQVELNKSLATFIIIFDDNGKPIASQAVLDGRIPTPPKGVFEYTKIHKEDRITWEPKANVRIASIIERFEGSNPGFILVGRSLAEVEKRVSTLGMQVKLGLAAALLGSLVILIIIGSV